MNIKEDFIRLEQESIKKYLNTYLKNNDRRLTSSKKRLIDSITQYLKMLEKIQMPPKMTPKAYADNLLALSLLEPYLAHELPQEAQTVLKKPRENLLDLKTFNIKDITPQIERAERHNQIAIHFQKRQEALNQNKGMLFASKKINKASVVLRSLLSFNINGPEEINIKYIEMQDLDGYLKTALTEGFPNLFGFSDTGTLIIYENDPTQKETIKKALGLTNENTKLDPKQFDLSALDGLRYNQNLKSPLWDVLKSIKPITPSFSLTDKVKSYQKLLNAIYLQEIGPADRTNSALNIIETTLSLIEKHLKEHPNDSTIEQEELKRSLEQMKPQIEFFENRGKSIFASKTHEMTDRCNKLISEITQPKAEPKKIDPTEIRKQASSLKKSLPPLPPLPPLPEDQKIVLALFQVPDFLTLRDSDLRTPNIESNFQKMLDEHFDCRFTTQYLFSRQFDDPEKIKTIQEALGLKDEHSELNPRNFNLIKLNQLYKASDSKDAFWIFLGLQATDYYALHMENLNLETRVAYLKAKLAIEQAGIDITGVKHVEQDEYEMVEKALTDDKTLSNATDNQNEEPTRKPLKLHKNRHKGLLGIRSQFTDETPDTLIILLPATMHFSKYKAALNIQSERDQLDPSQFNINKLDQLYDHTVDETEEESLLILKTMAIACHPTYTLEEKNSAYHEILEEIEDSENINNKGLITFINAEGEKNYYAILNQTSEERTVDAPRRSFIKQTNDALKDTQKIWDYDTLHNITNSNYFHDLALETQIKLCEKMANIANYDAGWIKQWTDYANQLVASKTDENTAAIQKIISEINVIPVISAQTAPQELPEVQKISRLDETQAEKTEQPKKGSLLNEILEGKKLKKAANDAPNQTTEQKKGISLLDENQAGKNLRKTGPFPPKKMQQENSFLTEIREGVKLNKRTNQDKSSNGAKDAGPAKLNEAGLIEKAQLYNKKPEQTSNVTQGLPAVLTSKTTENTTATNWTNSTSENLKAQLPENFTISHLFKEDQTSNTATKTRVALNIFEEFADKEQTEPIETARDPLDPAKFDPDTLTELYQASNAVTWLILHAMHIAANASLTPKAKIEAYKTLISKLKENSSELDPDYKEKLKNAFLKEANQLIDNKIKPPASTHYKDKLQKISAQNPPASPGASGEAGYKNT